MKYQYNIMSGGRDAGAGRTSVSKVVTGFTVGTCNMISEFQEFWKFDYYHGNDCPCKFENPDALFGALSRNFSCDIVSCKSWRCRAWQMTQQRPRTICTLRFVPTECMHHQWNQYHTRQAMAKFFPGHADPAVGSCSQIYPVHSTVCLRCLEMATIHWWTGMFWIHSPNVIWFLDYSRQTSTTMILGMSPDLDVKAHGIIRKGKELNVISDSILFDNIW